MSHDHSAGDDAHTLGTPDVDALARDLRALRSAMRGDERRRHADLRAAHPRHVEGAVNLAHYLAMRRFDLRDLQARLAAAGLSSLGRCESDVLANVDRVLSVLQRLSSRTGRPPATRAAPGVPSGAQRLRENARALFGDEPAHRPAWLMVTLPSQAATDDDLVASLVTAGMDVARINCAHDDAVHWVAMAERVRRAAARAGRTVRVLMDLGGPKLRTGPLPPRPAVVRVRPRRDDWGRVVDPARLWLCATGVRSAVGDAGPVVPVERALVEALCPGDEIRVVDARGARRRFKVLDVTSDGARLEGRQTAYLLPGLDLDVRRAGQTIVNGVIAVMADHAGEVTLARGDTLWLTDGVATHAASRHPRRRAAPSVACAEPAAITALRPGHHVWFDDGRIGAEVVSRGRGRVALRITQARPAGEPLRADQGINLPDTPLELPALTAKDFEDLDVAARHADLVGLSFAQGADDVLSLQRALSVRGAGRLGIVLKIETRRGFERLPEMLFAALRWPAAGIMIARGDLAVECGYERLAEVQEEILWACEAAHLPAIWATQVLESLAKSGRPSRAEITDAAMSERAECVMLNKGPYIVEAMRTLDGILCRMQTHQVKKRPLLRALRSWKS